MVTDGETVLQICSVLTAQAHTDCVPEASGCHWVRFCPAGGGALWVEQDGADGESSSGCSRAGLGDTHRAWGVQGPAGMSY